MDNNIDELERFANLHRQGALTLAEFEAIKAKLLGSGTPPNELPASQHPEPPLTSNTGDEGGRNEEPFSDGTTAWLKDPRIGVFLGPNAVGYKAQWVRMLSATRGAWKGGTKRVTWHWPAFLVPGPWLLYRKLWAPYVILVATAALAAVACYFLLGPWAVWLPGVALSLICGLGAQSFMLDQTRRKLREAEEAHWSNSKLAQSGGVSTLGAIVGLLVSIAAVVPGVLIITPVVRQKFFQGIPREGGGAPTIVLPALPPTVTPDTTGAPGDANAASNEASSAATQAENDAEEAAAAANAAAAGQGSSASAAQGALGGPGPADPNAMAALAAKNAEQALAAARAAAARKSAEAAAEAVQASSPAATAEPSSTPSSPQTNQGAEAWTTDRLLSEFRNADQACQARYPSGQGEADCHYRDNLARALGLRGLCWSWAAQPNGQRVWYGCRHTPSGPSG